MVKRIKDIGAGFGTKSIGGHNYVAGPYAADAHTEMAMHSESVHHPATKREREVRERLKRYDQAKAELAARRAASDT